MRVTAATLSRSGFSAPHHHHHHHQLSRRHALQKMRQSSKSKRCGWIVAARASAKGRQGFANDDAIKHTHTQTKPRRWHHSSRFACRLSHKATVVEAELQYRYLPLSFGNHRERDAITGNQGAWRWLPAWKPSPSYKIAAAAAADCSRHSPDVRLLRPAVDDILCCPPATAWWRRPPPPLPMPLPCAPSPLSAVPLPRAHLSLWRAAAEQSFSFSPLACSLAVCPLPVLAHLALICCCCCCCCELPERESTLNRSENTFTSPTSLITHPAHPGIVDDTTAPTPLQNVFSW